MALSYMGSKRRIAKDLYNVIASREGGAGIFVDLFCGGLSMSEMFANNGWDVIANDADKYLVAFLRDIMTNAPWLTSELIKPAFVNRETFERVALNNPDNYPAAFAGYIRVIWSFSNNGRSYMYGKKTEPIQHAAHDYIVYDDPDKLLELLEERDLSISAKCFMDMSKIPILDYEKRRLMLQREACHCKDRRFRELERIIHLSRINAIRNTMGLEIKRLSCSDYRDVDIPSGAVVYCDPPYRKTAHYSFGDFDSDEFWRWAERQSKRVSVYVSEESAPEGWVSIYARPLSRTMSSDGTRKPAIEKLYIYGGNR